MNKIGFIGSNNIDTMLYLSRLCVNLNYNVAIIDASNEQLLKYSIPDSENNEVNYRGADFYLNQMSAECIEKPKDKEEYRVVLVNYGFRHGLKQELEQCDMVVVSTDFDRANILKLKDMLDQIEVINIVKVYRDVVKSKITPKYIDCVLGLDRFRVEKSYVIKLDNHDVKSRLLSQYDDIFTFDMISSEHRALLTELAEEYMEADYKALMKAIKRAERGK